MMPHRNLGKSSLMGLIRSAWVAMTDGTKKTGKAEPTALPPGYMARKRSTIQGVALAMWDAMGRSRRLPKPDLVKSVWATLKGRDTHPAQPPLAQPPHLGHPAVPRPAQGDLNLGPVADGLDEDGVVEHLHIDAEGIHVPNPEVHIAYLAGFLLGA